MVMGVSYDGGGILNGGTARACCAGTSGSVALGCAGTPGSTVAFVGGAIIFVRFACP